jgi:lipoprotein-anchoring transpeptidase ErfK/SrfK
MGSRRTWGLAAAACAVTAACVGSAGAAMRDACPSFAGGSNTGALSVAYPTGSVLVGSAAAQLGVQAGVTSGQASVAVEYGPSTDYGLCSTPTALATGAAPQTLQTMVSGLSPATAYHYRAVVTTATDTLYGADQTFTTLPPGEIAQGATIDGVPVGGLTQAAALGALRQLFAAPARLSFDKQHWSVARAQLGAKIAGDAITPALQAAPAQALTAPIGVDPQKLTSYLKTANRRYGRAAQPESARLVGRRALVVPAHAGIRIDTIRARAAITAYVTHQRTSVLSLPTSRTPAPHSQDEKAVVVRLGSQTLTAYLDGKPVLRTPVTTGRPALPTPIGSYSVQSRHSPYTFTSPWPKGNPYWYPPTPATWAMYFYDNDFLHDDPGEPASAFGSGSENGPYASHGCVHVPHDAMAFLYQWLPIGATVIVAQD